MKITTGPRLVEHNHAYVHSQATPLDEWHITHDLGFHPAVAVVDSANTVVHGVVTHIDKRELVVRFRGAFSGKAFLS